MEEDRSPSVGQIAVGQQFLHLVPVILAIGVGVICYQFYRHQMSILRQDAERLCELRGRQIASQIEHSVNTRISRADGLMHVVALDPEITNDEFAAYAERLLQHDPGLRSAGLSPGNMIRSVYPLEGNESAIGKDLLKVPDQAPAVRAMMESEQPVLAGPLNLLQGGRAFIYRVPVMIPTQSDDDEALSSNYWGHIALVVEYDLLLEELKSLIPDDLQASLSQRTLGDGRIQTLISDATGEMNQQIAVSVSLPGVDWELYLSPKSGWPNRLPDHTARLLAGLVFSGLAAFVAWMLVRSHLIQSRYVVQLQQAQQAMQLEKDRLQLALTHGKIGLWECDIAGGNSEFSNTFPSIINGEDRSAAIASQDGWESRLHPDDKSAAVDGLHQFLTGHEDSYQAEYRLRCGDGYRWFRSEASTTESGDRNKRRVMGVLLDVTEDREMKDRLKDERLETQLILDSIPSLVILQDSKSKILRANEAVVRATGLQHDELPGMVVDDVIPGCGHLQTSGESGIVRCVRSRSADFSLAGDRWVQTQRIALRNSKGWTDQHVIVSTDITELKRAEQLQERANRFQVKVGELALIGGWELDCLTNELMWSDQVKLIHEVPLDYQPDVASAIQFYRADARDQIQRVIARAIENEARWDVELPLITAKGRQIYVRAMGQPVFEDGQCVSIWGVFQDVTQIHQENELRESLFRNAPNAYLLYNDNGIIECNPKAVQMLAATSRIDLLGKQPADFSPEYQPCGTLSTEKRRPVDQLANELGIHRFEWTHQRLNGELFPCEVTLSRIETNSGPSLLAAWRDLSGLKAAERERDNFFVLSPDLFCVVDEHGCFKRVNSAWLQVAGARGESLRGMRVADLTIPEHREATEQMLTELLNAGKVSQFRNQVQWIDGSVRWLEWNAKSSAHDRTVYFAVARDVTERIQSEQKLSALNEELHASNLALQQSNVDLQQFVYVASHDLQAPLRGIAGFAELMIEECADQLDETAAGFLERISTGTKRMQQLIKDLLKYSRIQVQGEKQDSASLVPVSLNQIIDDILTLMQPELEERGARVNCEKLPFVHGDASQLSQLFSNLIGNAVKYNSSEVPEVTVAGSTVAAEPDQAKGGYIEVTVRDNGIGIDPRFHEQIFEVFRRLHAEREYAGTGIGLAICKRVMQRHQGEIWVSNITESGTCFHLRFPLPESGD